MSKPVPTHQPKRLVWRISEAAPLGEWVEPSTPRAGKPARSDSFVLEDAHGSWITSSFDLLQGTDVKEVPLTMSDADFEEMVSSWKARAGSSTPR